jgi:flagellar protein FliS
MFGSTRNGANAYAKVGIETGVVSASPHKLTAMLFDGATMAVVSAMQQMKSGNIPAKGQAISKAILLIDSGLRASLDKKLGGEIAENLDALYEYMSHQLLLANLHNQPERLEEVHGLLSDLKATWDAIGVSANAISATTTDAPATPTASSLPKSSAYDALAPRSANFMTA